jgi:hypothetical protein
MAQAEISGISPFFIVSHVPSSLSFYQDRLGFKITFQGLLTTFSARRGLRIRAAASKGLYLRDLSRPERRFV